MVAVQAVGSTIMTILVLGATGNTGKHVVRQLLDQGHRVKAIVRSKQRLIDVLPKSIVPTDDEDDDADINEPQPNLIITEGSILDMNVSILQEHVKDTDVVVSCLGHTMDFTGIFGHATRRLVTDTTKRVIQAMIEAMIEEEEESKQHRDGSSTAKKMKYILMSSDGVVNLDGTDDKRSYLEEFLFSIIRTIVPPHADNEDAAAVLYALGKGNDTETNTNMIEWMIVRPATLLDGNASEYKLLKQPGSALFGTGKVTRANVAKAIVDCITNDNLWEQWKFQFPVVHDIDTTVSSLPSTQDL